MNLRTTLTLIGLTTVGLTIVSLAGPAAATAAATAAASEDRTHVVLESRAQVTEMADDVLRRLDQTTFVEPGVPAGVAVFALEQQGAEPAVGVGVAQQDDGEAFFLNVRGQLDPVEGNMERYVIFFYD